MRQLSIARYKPLSRVIQLELTYLTEMAELKKLPTAEIIALLKRLYCGDKSVIPDLVEANLLMILSTARQYTCFNVPIAEMIAGAKDSLYDFFLHLSIYGPGNEHYPRFLQWHIRNGILLTIHEHTGFFGQRWKAMMISDSILHTGRPMLAEQKPFLEKLNRHLKQLELQILTKATELLTLGEAKRTAIEHYSSDCLLDVAVSYFFGMNEEPEHLFETHFSYKQLVLENNTSLLTNGTDWRESYMPVLSEGYCYLLHDLIDHGFRYLHSRMSSLRRIWVDVRFTDQLLYKLDEQGNVEQERYVI